MTVSRSQPVSYLSADHVVLNSLHCYNYELTNEYSLSSHRASLPNYRLHVLLQSRSITDSKCISKLARLQPPSVSPTSHDSGLHVRMITASKCISNLTPSQPPRVSLNSHDYGLQVRTITAYKCISKLARLRPPSAYLQTRSITASKFARAWPPSASPNSLAHSLQVHLYGAMAGVQRYRGNGGGQSDGEYTIGRPRSR